MYCFSISVIAKWSNVLPTSTAHSGVTNGVCVRRKVSIYPDNWYSQYEWINEWMVPCFRPQFSESIVQEYPVSWEASTTCHLHTQLDPSASKLMMLSAIPKWPSSNAHTNNISVCYGKTITKTITATMTDLQDSRDRCLNVKWQAIA